MSVEPTADLVRALQELGFSQYEAQCYVGLMAAEPQTGYRVSKVTGVPQPKVYETLRKLVSRGVVREIAGDPTVFSAIPPDALLRQLEDSFERRLADAKDSARRLEQADMPRELEYVERFASREDILRVAVESIAGAARRVYLSASAAELAALKDAIEEATARDVDVVVLAFGRGGADLRGARVFRHASTDGALFRHHQAKHIALVTDSREAVNAIAADGSCWEAIRTESKPVIAAVKGFIRHDLDLQQVFADFAPQLIEAYGPGLQALESYSQEQHTTEERTKRVASPKRKTG
ncbi:helix-turn-helix domain-containing protein [Sphaerisporangium sp. NPDC051017]|uniref:TrmB family transcriptional regulator n=1 Tax=Sphaerisporangium sp. NPDC051017 TaxID=3154636 RepID=UPI0034326798